MTYERKVLFIESNNYIEAGGTTRYMMAMVADTSNANRLQRQIAIVNAGTAKILAFYHQAGVTEPSSTWAVSLNSGEILSGSWVLAEGVGAKFVEADNAVTEGQDVSLRLTDIVTNDSAMRQYLSAVFVF